ncbi:MAG: hypothetical protein MUO22_01305, partial [Sedimentisphaerales bacterium]|nr:hypothetical protein [Sedimentisphaerales bacterium]
EFFSLSEHSHGWLCDYELGCAYLSCGQGWFELDVRLNLGYTKASAWLWEGRKKTRGPKSLRKAHLLL